MCNQLAENDTETSNKYKQMIGEHMVKSTSIRHFQEDVNLLERNFSNEISISKTDDKVKNAPPEYSFSVDDHIYMVRDLVKN